jgi:LEA14-like dessication related protein
MKTIFNEKNKILKLIALSGVVLTTSTSCGAAGDILKNIFQQPKVSIQSFGLDDASTERLNFKAVLNVDNPNSFGLKTSDVDYNLDINNADIIKGVLANGINISAQNTSTVEIPIQVNFQKLFAALPSIIQDINNLNYKVYGTVNFNTPIGKVPISWQKEDKLNIGNIAQLFIH